MRKTALFAVAILLMAGLAQAAPVSPTNVRPVPWFPIDSPTLQDELNAVFGAGSVDAQDDQQPAGYFQVATGSGVTSPRLRIKGISGHAGIFTLPGLDDSNPIATADIFPSTSASGDVATVIWLTPNSGLITFVDVSAGTSTTTAFSNIDVNGFGFFWDRGSRTYYTLDDLNDNDEARVLAFTDGATNWLFGFEDGSLPGNDYNEVTIVVESLRPIPEPGTLALMGLAGLGMIGIAIRRRRRA